MIIDCLKGEERLSKSTRLLLHIHRFDMWMESGEGLRAMNSARQAAEKAEETRQQARGVVQEDLKKHVTF